MSSSAATAWATVLLVVVGVAQFGVLLAQHRRHRLDLADTYWRRWNDSQQSWASVVFVGRDPGAFYQVAEGSVLEELTNNVAASSAEAPSMWALQPLANVTGVLSDICLHVLSGQLNVSDAYAILGTAVLRQSRPLRRLLNPASVAPTDDDDIPGRPDDLHRDVQTEMQDWLIYHDGVRRRCLILVDLLWAEGARLEDLPPEDMKKAASAKRQSGKLNRKRLIQECLRLRGVFGVVAAFRLGRFLRHAEYMRTLDVIGLETKRLEELSAQWEGRLLREDA